MNSDEIQRYVSETNTIVCASDQLPSWKIDKGIFISNTDELKKSGSHWVLLAVLPGREVIYFDSLSVPPLIVYFYNFLKANVEGGTFELNKSVIQSTASIGCGKYCTLLAWHLFEGGKFSDFCKMYSGTPLMNDKKMEGHWALFLKSIKTRARARKSVNHGTLPKAIL
jgi:hypothetical protein